MVSFQSRAEVFIVANFKAYLAPQPALELLEQLQSRVKSGPQLALILCPSPVSLVDFGNRLDRRNFGLGSQIGPIRATASSTGLVSFGQLSGLVDYSLIGAWPTASHDLSWLQLQVAESLEAGIKPIICLGETETDLANQETGLVLKDQLQTALAGLDHSEISQLVIVYRPFWAVSTNPGSQAASPGQVRSALTVIRQSLNQIAPDDGPEVRLLYGGSVTASNAELFLGLPDLAGLLVGTASLNPFELAEIANLALQRHN